MKSNENLEDFFSKNKVDVVSNARFFKRLKQKRPKDLDARTHAYHAEAFQKIDCLKCANCCKTTGPLIIDKDIQRISKFLGLTESQFERQYLRRDEDGDWVLQTLPCPFLAPDNRCNIYDFRPRACSTYPHTDRIKQHQILNITEKNVGVCPAVFEIVEKLKRHYQ
jgi:uncharacterized protein